jgi:transposase-like protein
VCRNRSLQLFDILYVDLNAHGAIPTSASAQAHHEHSPKRAAESRITRLVDALRTKAKSPKLADWIEETAHETLGFYALEHAEHHRRMKTTNWIEHDHAEVRRRTRVVRIFPNEASLIRLTTALAVERNEQWLERCYLPMNESQNDDTRMLRQTA